MLKIISTLSIAFLFVGCSKIQTVTNVAPQPNVVQLNTKFEIKLPENHTTGYIWQLKNTYDASVADYINAVWHGNEKGVAFNFEASKTGKTELVFNLIKYRDTLETKRFIIEVQ